MKLKGTIYQWIKPDERFESEYGEINGRDWLVKEAARINKSNSERFAEVVSRADGRMNVEALPFWV